MVGEKRKNYPQTIKKRNAADAVYKMIVFGVRSALFVLSQEDISS